MRKPGERLRLPAGAGAISSSGEDEQREIFVADPAKGRVLRVVSAARR
jgi:hypothetical protein